MVEVYCFVGRPMPAIDARPTSPGVDIFVPFLVPSAHRLKLLRLFVSKSNNDEISSSNAAAPGSVSYDAKLENDGFIRFDQHWFHLI